MTTKAEDILEAINTKLTNIIATSLWTTVERDRSHGRPIEESDLIALSIEMVGSTPIDSDDGYQVYGFLDSFLEVNIDVYLKESIETEKPTTKQNAIYQQLYVELLLDHTLGGLSQLIVPRGFAQVVVDDQIELPTITFQTTWLIKYRHNYLNPSL